MACGLVGCQPAGPDADALFASVSLDFMHGDLDLAQSRAQTARRQFESKTLPDDRAWALKFRLLEARTLLSEGRAQDALGLLNDGAASFPADGDLAIERDIYASRAYRSLDDQDDAARLLRDARRMAESTQSNLMAEVLYDEANVDLDAGRLQEASDKLADSLARAREIQDPLLQATDLMNLGYASFHSGHFDQALGWSQQAVSLAKTIQARPVIQLAQGHIGYEYMNLGEFELALDNFQQAERWSLQAGKTRSRIIWLEDAGMTEYKLGNMAEAERYDGQALQAALTLNGADDIDGIVNLEANLALLRYTEGQYAAAKTYSDAAALKAQGSKDSKVIAYAEFLQGLIAARLGNPQQAEGLMHEAWQRTPDSETRMEIENALANVNADVHRSAEAERWYRQSIETFEKNRASIQNEGLRLSSFAYGDSVYRDYAQFLIDTQRPRDALSLLDASRARTLEEGLGLSPQPSAVTGKHVIDAQSAARTAGATILFYSLGTERSYLWAVSAREVQLYTLPARRKIESLVADYQKAIQSSADPAQGGSQPGDALYEALIRPAQAMVPPGSRVYLVPDGALVGLNFETLPEPTAQDSRYWIEDVTVTTISSIRLLSRRSSNAGTASKSLLLIGNPLGASDEFQALSHGADEVGRVARHFPPLDQQVITQAAAVPASYVANTPGQYRYLHFVAHGTASRLSPLESAIVLSPVPQHAQDFKLYARDIVQQPLHAQLVTISACYSSGVRAYAGEGLVGLAWAFLRAGAHNVIGALWEVNDDSTPRLMDALYSELESGKTPDAALRAAKLSLLHTEGVYRRPYYWGAFQLYAGA